MNKNRNLSNVLKIVLTLMFLMASINVALGSPDITKSIPVCGKESSGYVRCMSYVVVNNLGEVETISPFAAYGPNDFLGAYNLGTGMTSTKKTIAIIDAYDDPNMVSDLKVYSQKFGLPLLDSTCPVSSGTSAHPCFQKVDQRGSTHYPSFDRGWALEISMDVEVAHAICKNCNILLVEADSASYVNIMKAFDRAVAMGADIISNSYGSSEFPTETSLDSHFNLPGKAITFSSGDDGYGTEYPAASPYVTSVGGTTLRTNPRSETTWGGAGSGCSRYERKPSFQTDIGCSKRTIADVSADADPATGAAVYDSTYGGWVKVGGTSLSAPLIAGVYALARGFSGKGNEVPYRNKNYGVNIYDVTRGGNGNCGNTYLCTAGPGYDGPTGLGSPIGIGAFGGVPPTGITVVSPNGGENWARGSTKLITWTLTGSPGPNVKILLYKGGILKNTISSSTPNDGSYSWIVPLSLPIGSDYKIKIMSTSSTYNDLSNNNFKIS